MKTLNNQVVLKLGIFFSALLFVGSSETNSESMIGKEQRTPLLEEASEEYADLVLKSLDLLTEFNLNKFSNMLADDVMWFWPDGTSETRTILKGKDQVIAWWKNWEQTTGGKMSFAEHTLLPIKLNRPSNQYKVVGTGVIAYTDLTIAIGDRSTSVRQNLVFMFNKDKKVSHVFLYYDRSAILEFTKVALGGTE